MVFFDEGLVTKHDPRTENRNTFYAIYLNLGGTDQGFNSFMKAKQLPNGLYLRSSIHTSRTVSNDELTGWIVSSKLLNSNHKFYIWEILTSNNGAYPAVIHNWTDRLPYNLGNYYAWGDICGSKLSKIFLPFYLASLVVASFMSVNDTSTKIQHWLLLTNLNKNIVNQGLLWFFEKRMKQQYGSHWLGSLLTIYFASEDKDEFPIFVALKDYYASEN